MKNLKLNIEKYNFDNDVIEASLRAKSPKIKIYRPKDFFIVLGRGSKPEAELNVERCLEDRIKKSHRRCLW